MANIAVNKPLMCPAYSTPFDFDVIVRAVGRHIPVSPAYLPKRWEVTVKVGDNWRKRKFSTTANYTERNIREVAMGVAWKILQQLEKQLETGGRMDKKKPKKPKR